MVNPEFLLEAHFYAGGLRHETYATGKSRPAWVPASDAVGFQDEFPIKEGDAAVEVRRFQMAEDRTTWVAVYFRSVDAKLGDRKNHAGVGLWLRNGLISNFPDLLYGLTNLAEFIASKVDPKALGTHVDEFLKPSFLPSYLIEQSELPFARGMPFAAPGVVDTRQYAIACGGSVGECRALADYLLNLTLVSDDKDLEPRSLIWAASPSSAPQSTGSKIKVIPEHFDVTSALITTLPSIFSDLSRRAARAEEEANAAQAKSRAAEDELNDLRRENGELTSLRADPMQVVLNRLESLSRQVANLNISQPSYSPPPSALAIPVKRSPVSPGQPQGEPEYETDWIKLAALVSIVVLIPLLGFMIYQILMS